MREMTDAELTATLGELEKQADAEYKEWMKRPKEELLAKVSQVMRVHGLSLRDSKRDLVYAILDQGVNARRASYQKEQARRQRMAEMAWNAKNQII